jgi:hypothetical protein
MALSELERKRYEKAVAKFLDARRPPPEIRAKLDFGFRIEGQSVEIFEVRPAWRRPNEIMEHSVAKATFVRTTGVWKVFWKRADLNWHGYAPTPVVGTIDKFLEVVEADPHACFWG